MGQQEIYQLLKKRSEWVLSRELLDITKMSPSGLYRLLRILERNRDIIKKKANKVIRDRKKLEKTSRHAWAYKVKK